MKFSRRALIRAGVLVALALFAYVIVWPAIAAFLWLNNLVSVVWPTLVAIMLMILASIVDAATDDENA